MVLPPTVLKPMVLLLILLRVAVARKDVLLLVRIATNLQAFVELYHIVTKKMVLQPIVLPVNADQLNVLLIPASIAINL